MVVDGRVLVRHNSFIRKQRPPQRESQMNIANVEIDLSDLIAQEMNTAEQPNTTNTTMFEATGAEIQKTAYIQWNRHEHQWHAIYNGKAVMKNSSKQYGDNILLRAIQKQANRKVQLLGITNGVIVTEDFKIPNAPEKFNSGAVINQLDGAPLDFSKHTLASEFSIGERFNVLEKFVLSAAYMATAEEGSVEHLAANPMVIITGSGGLGKTYTTTKVLQEHGLVRADDMDIGDVLYGRSKGYAVISGYTTAKALFRKLWEHREGWVIVLDDCDAALKSADAVNILKGAGDSGDRRIITWNAENFNADDELPKTFEFRSSIIIITNLDRMKVPQPIRSRAMNADVSMTREEVVERIETLIEGGEFMSQYPFDAKYEVLEYIKDGIAKDPKFNAMVKTLNMRTFVVAVKAWVAHGGVNWERAALYNMASASEE